MLNSVKELKSFIQDWFKKLELAPEDVVLDLAKILVNSKLARFEQDLNNEIRSRCLHAYECGKLGKSYNYEEAHKGTQKVPGPQEMSSECIILGSATK